MTFFFDTNICIGYIFKLNPWHEKSNEIFNKEDESYWSETVKDETDKVFDNLIEEYVQFFDNLIDKVENSKKDVFYENDLIHIGKNIPVTKNHAGKNIINKQNIIMSIWEDNGQYEQTKEELITFFNVFSPEFNRKSFERYIQCSNILNLHPKTSNYNELKKIFINNNIHHPDWQICLDGHDLSCSVNDLIFVTADVQLYNSLINIIDKTNIKDILKLDNLKIFS